MTEHFRYPQTRKHYRYLPVVTVVVTIGVLLGFFILVLWVSAPLGR